MFEKDLKARVQRIFGFMNTRFEEPSDSKEQEAMFINIEDAVSNVSERLQKARVTGTLYVYANFDKLPYGYFEKRIMRADPADTSKFFFTEIDKNLGVTNNIARRSIGFVYLYSGQYDPDIGEINLVNFQEGES